MTTRLLSLLVTVFIIIAAGDAFAEAAAKTAVDAEQANAALTLDVYKSEACGCCQGWVSHMEEGGFALDVTNTTELNSIKQERGIDPKYQSCHTAVTQKGDYFFEGHIPARIIKQFLMEKPKGAVGLAVPGMPVGSPGMEMGDRFHPYDVLQINRDGSSKRYARVTTAEEQY